MVEPSQADPTLYSMALETVGADSDAEDDDALPHGWQAIAAPDGHPYYTMI